MKILLLHIAICILFLFIHGRLKIKDRFPAVFVICIPVYGLIMWAVCCYLVLNRRDNSKSPDIEKLKVTDARFRRIHVDETDKQDQAIPLEEALVMNDTRLRRSLMLDILHKNPEEYMDMLKKASSSDDVEVTHYATTTLLEIQSNYEFTLQKNRTKCMRDGERIENWQEYRDNLVSYINSGLPDGTVLKMQRRNLMEVLTRLMEWDHQDKEDIYCYIEQALELGEYVEAGETLKKYEKMLGNEERWYKLSVRYEWELGNTEKIQLLLQQIRDQKIYLTSEGKRWYSFWVKGEAVDED